MKRRWIRAPLGIAIAISLAFVPLFVAAPAGAAQVKQHQATGTVLAVAPTQVTILKKVGRNTTKWSFIVNANTKLEAKPAKSMRVRIYYHEEKSLRIADRIRGVVAAPAAAPAAPSTSPVPAPARN